jgi:hypothetical protein
MDTTPSSDDPAVSQAASHAMADLATSATVSEHTVVTDPSSQPKHADYFKVYEEYAKTLRTWLVAYGVGGPVLFVTNKDVAEKLAASHAAPSIAKLFLAGVGLQIFLAMVNKTVMWANYWSELYPEEATKIRFRFAYWVSSQYWIDFSIDIVTVILFGAATLGAFRVIVAGV